MITECIKIPVEDLLPAVDVEKIYYLRKNTRQIPDGSAATTMSMAMK